MMELRVNKLVCLLAACLAVGGGMVYGGVGALEIGGGISAANVGEMNGGEVPRSAVQAASDAAVRGLKDQVDRLPIGNMMSVGEYLKAVKGDEFMVATLQRAQLIGGPRELGAGVGGGGPVVQVRLDISGKVVADALSQIAAVHGKGSYGKRSPVGADVVARESRAWADRTLTATGISTGEVVVPGPVVAAGGQGAVPPAAIPGAGGGTGPAVTVTPVVGSGGGGTGGMPATMPSGVGPTTMGGAAGTPGAAVGAGVGARVLVVPVDFVVDRPPVWFFESIDASGSAGYAGTKLLTARAAEEDALRLLKKQLEALPLTKEMTLGDAAKRDGRYAEAVARAVERARVYRVEYVEDGSANVKVSIDPRYLWQDLVSVWQTTR